MLKVSGQECLNGYARIYFDGTFFVANLQSGSYILASYGVYPGA